jgi:fluoride exporter
VSPVAYAWVALGGAIGSVARLWLTLAMAALTGPRYPWGTLLINVVGSFVIGWFGALAGPQGRFAAISPDIRLFVTVGICGGFTTFSSFSLQTFELLRTGEAPAAILYAAASVVLCLTAAWAGVMVGR